MPPERHSLTEITGSQTPTENLSLPRDDEKTSAVLAASQQTRLLETFFKGVGCKNWMTIQNVSSDPIELSSMYMHKGTTQVAPKDKLHQMEEDVALFCAQNSLSKRGSSGLLCYRLDGKTLLHVMWDCPFSFKYSDNFVSLLLDHDGENVDERLYKSMHQFKSHPFKVPRPGSEYDLVCCGPSDGLFHDPFRDVWGIKRPCVVENLHYKVSLVMGDTHATESLLTITNKNGPNLNFQCL